MTSNLALGVLLVGSALTLVLGVALVIAGKGPNTEVASTSPAPAAVPGDDHGDPSAKEAAVEGKTATSTRREYAGDPRSVGFHLAIDPGDVAVHFDSAAKVIHAVHGDGGLPTIPARRNGRLKTTEAEYVYISSEAQVDRPPSGHEVPGIQRGARDRSSHRPPVPRVARLRLRQRRGVSRRQEDHGRDPRLAAVQGLEKELKTTKSGRLRDHLRYLKQPEEMFARAYTQYIATRGQDPELLSASRCEQRTAYGKMIHWDESTFEPIAKLFDAMFRKVGWSHD